MCYTSAHEGYGLLSGWFDVVTHAHAPQPRDRVEVIYARKAPSRLPLIHVLQAAQTEVFLQLLHAVPLLQPQAAEVSARSGSVDNGIARQLPSLHAAASRAAPKAQQIGPGDELGLARVRDALHRGVQRLAVSHEDDLLPRS